MNYPDRLKRVRAGAQSESLDAVLFTHLPNIFYLSGFRGSTAALVVSPTRNVLIVDGRYTTQAQSQTQGCEVVTHAKKEDGIRDVLLGMGVKRVGFEPRAMSVELYQSLVKILPDIEWAGLGSWITSFRASKDPAEIAILRRAHGMADRGLEALIPRLKAGLTEKEIALELELEMRRRGAEGVSFPSIIASGSQGALPHAQPTDRKLTSGDTLIIDFGCSLEGYQTDQTVTLHFGKPDAELRKVFDLVLRAHDKAIEALKPGVRARDVDAVARQIISDGGYGPQFSHSLGHGIGVEVHEWPLLATRSEDVLGEGMVFTIEPGIYLPGKGGVRIEDTVVLGASGVELLTTVDKAFRTL